MDFKDDIALQKILSYCNIAVDFCKDINSCEEFENNLQCNMACIFALMQIGEIVSSVLSDDIKNSAATIPWKQIKGLRNRIVHGYDGIDYQTVWDTIKQDLPKLIEEISKLRIR